MLSVNFHPFPVLQTERCLLRQLKAEDAEEILVLRSDETIIKYLDREPATSIDEAKDFITKTDESLFANTGISWAVCFHNNSKLIGTVGLWRLIKEHYRAEIGYVLHSRFWKQGIMNEVLKEMVRYGFQQMGLHSLEANVNPQNMASIKLLEKQGFVREAYFKENFYYNGAFLDSAVYSLIAPK